MIINAILKINPNAKVTVAGTNIDTCKINWLEGTTPISKADIEAQLPIVEFDMAMYELRQKRDRLLAATDWTQLPDVGFNAAERTAWMNYRQALRDITNNIETADQANSIVFPAKPQ